MSKLILTVGTSHCGKTSWAEEYIKANPNTIELCRDQFRYTKETPNRDHYIPTHMSEERIAVLMANAFYDNVREGKDIIISDTNLTWVARDIWTERAYHADIDLEFVIFHSFFQRITSDPSLAFKLPDYVLKHQYIRFKEFLKEDQIPGVTYTIV